MTRRLPLVVAALALAAPAAASARQAAPLLQGEVGPGFTIEVTRSGKDVKTLKPGTYRLHVEDKSSLHDFHLIGPGVNKRITTVPFTGEKTVTVKLRKGVYTYQCDPHANVGMRGTFRVR